MHPSSQRTEGTWYSGIFEEENINTLTEKSELMLTILAFVAQSELENISTNIRWSIINRFETGTYVISTPAYGYTKDEQGNLIIVEHEAKVVRQIYESYLNGMIYMVEKDRQLLSDRGRLGLI